MPDPIVFVSHSTVRDGKLEALKEASEEAFAALEADKLGTVFQYGYLDRDKSQVHFVHIFPDADAMDAHMVGAAERVSAAAEFIETTAFEIYGAPSAMVLEALGQNPSVEVTQSPGSLGGYIRLGN